MQLGYKGDWESAMRVLRLRAHPDMSAVRSAIGALLRNARTAEAMSLLNETLAREKELDGKRGVNRATCCCEDSKEPAVPYHSVWISFKHEGVCSSETPSLLCSGGALSLALKAWMITMRGSA
jgi:hypothetical protein